MPRPPSDWKATHQAADKVEPRLAAALRRTVMKLRDGVSITELVPRLAMAQASFAGGGAVDQKAVDAILEQLLPKAVLEDALQPGSQILRETVLRGGRVAAGQVNEAAER
jgi:hypothetical protein